MEARTRRDLWVLLAVLGVGVLIPVAFTLNHFRLLFAGGDRKTPADERDLGTGSRLEIRVTRDGKAAPGVLLLLGGPGGGAPYPGVTDSVGRWSLEPAPGEYEIGVGLPPPWTLSPPAACPCVDSIRVTIPPEPGSRSADLALSGTVLTVRVSNASDEHPHPGAHVTLSTTRPDHRTLEATTPVDASGSVIAHDLPAGHWTVRASGPSPDETATLEFDLSANESRNLSLRLPASAR